MRFSKLPLKIALVIVLFSCSSNNSEKNKLIIGNWQGIEWLIGAYPSGHNPANAVFNFTDKGTYSFKYADDIEKGTYKIENDMLFTTPTGQQEIMVKIMKLTKDSLVFDMNRGGQQETLTLMRK